MLALYRSGRQPDALEAFREARRVLSEELALEPGPDLRRLQEAILAHDPAIAPVAVAPRRRGNLPAPSTSFVGREQEVAQVVELLREHRLVTLTGRDALPASRLSGWSEVRRHEHGQVTRGISMDYGHELLFGTFITPAAQRPHHAVELAVVADRAGLDLVTFQDHPYQPGFLDTWTLLTYVAARTSRVRLSHNVLNLPLRPPVMLARAAASVDLLSGGRLELGIGAGRLWDAIEAMGGPRRTPGEAVEALEEAITIIRDVWAADKPNRVFFDGKHYRAGGAPRGPAPAHDVGIWVGAGMPRMLRLVGRRADGWSVPIRLFLPGGPPTLAEPNRMIDEAAAAAGRDPSAVRRILTFPGRFSRLRGDLLDGPPAQWAEELADMALRYGVGAFVLGSDEAATIERFAAEVVPATRELVAAERHAAATA